MTEALHTLYRPVEFEDVVGQSAIVKAVKNLVEKGTSQCFLFCGPSGVGKTTLARIIANKVGCQRQDVLEFDASTNTGIDHIRNLQIMLQYRPFSGGNMAIIIDEAQGLTKQAWNALLKVTEEPPKHVYFFLCTTVAKMAATIESRFSKFSLRPIQERELLKLVQWVAKEEGVKLDPDVAQLIAYEAQGSARLALNHLAKVGHMDNPKEARQALASADEETPEIAALCQFIIKGGSWSRGMELLDKLQEPPESIRIVVCNYLAKVLRGQKNERSTMDLLRKLECFAVPYSQGEAQPQLILSVGRALFAD